MNPRIKTLQQSLQADGLDGAFYATSANLQYYLDDTAFGWRHSSHTGFVNPGPNGHHLNVPDCILYVPADEEPTLYMDYGRSTDLHPTHIRHKVGFFCCLSHMMYGEIKGSRFATGESCSHFLRETVGDVVPNAKFVDGEFYGCRQRAIKDEAEIAKMRRVASFTDYAMGEVVKALKPGVTNMDIMNLIGQIGYDAGCRELSFSPTVRFYKTNGNQPFQVDGYPTISTLEEGCSISFDFGFVMDGYCSDFGRSFYMGKAPAEIRRGYELLQEAQCQVIESYKPGGVMTDGFGMIRDHLQANGYDTQLRQYFDFELLGHQLGIEVHEGPWLHTEQAEPLQTGMVFTVEPKFWWPDHCFTRVEDMVLITENGCECLTNYPRDQFEL